jgi:hypothetical protein
MTELLRYDSAVFLRSCFYVGTVGYAFAAAYHLWEMDTVTLDVASPYVGVLGIMLLIAVLITPGVPEAILS